MTLDLKHLRDVATAATPGPWQMNGARGKFAELRDTSQFHSVGPDADAVAAVFYDPKTHIGFMDAKFIAEFDPPTVLALLDEIERLREAKPLPSVEDVAKIIDGEAFETNIGGTRLRRSRAKLKATAILALIRGEGE